MDSPLIPARLRLGKYTVTVNITLIWRRFLHLTPRTATATVKIKVVKPTRCTLRLADRRRARPDWGRFSGPGGRLDASRTPLYKWASCRPPRKGRWLSCVSFTAVRSRLQVVRRPTSAQVTDGDDPR